MKRESIFLVGATLALVLVGLLMVYSIGAIRSPSGTMFYTHAAYALAGVAAMLILAHVDYHALFSPFVYVPFTLVVLALLVLVLIPGIGVEMNGAQRWLRVFGVQFQPSELAKIALLILLAVKLTENQTQLGALWRGFVPAVGIAGLFAVLIQRQNDLGMPVVLMSAAFAMIFVAGARWRHVVVSAVIGVGLVVVLSVASPHRLERLRMHQNPWEFRNDEGFQLVQSLTAIARGGIWGTGPGASEQKLFYLPAAHTDFIFAIWAEEMGLVGCLALLALYVAIVLVAVRIAANARDLFGGLLAVGIIALIAFQAAFIISVATGLVPTKGMPLPFVSYGGTALIVSLALMGILINIGRQAQTPVRERPLVAAA
ncbi:MAG TPA: putative lipid II flippase FtsW [Candidatus Hydrogenedentes bacterium]|nr:putative lipid II flippase FtsW [Candidatus Hydrogenedentota bacterium]